MANDDTEAPDLMPAEQTRVIADFLEWSGGALVCETTDMIDLYLEVARPSDLDRDAVEECLLHAADAGL